MNEPQGTDRADGTSVDTKMVRYTYDPNNPPKFSDEERARLNAMTDADIIAAAESDPDNRPMTNEEWTRGRRR